MVFTKLSKRFEASACDLALYKLIEVQLFSSVLKENCVKADQCLNEMNFFSGFHNFFSHWLRRLNKKKTIHTIYTSHLVMFVDCWHSLKSYKQNWILYGFILYFCLYLQTCKTSFDRLQMFLFFQAHSMFPSCVRAIPTLGVESLVLFPTVSFPRIRLFLLVWSKEVPSKSRAMKAKPFCLM